ncbi:hypothetical protein LEM8419_03507 [Neolewinella maritima]|uniref:Uncharacterized protein n=1 Tax=Neolewinella maritima TaxID=1383882 RepID=A0ABM9B5G1_9BACT|nr:hypothetical protein [Neolewinella maritima]CAH1002635.1 hypothetical protein LEM8419_03507 [Neolewinella maritima]
MNAPDFTDLPHYQDQYTPKQRVFFLPRVNSKHDVQEPTLGIVEEYTGGSFHTHRIRFRGGSQDVVASDMRPYERSVTRPWEILVERYCLAEIAAEEEPDHLITTYEILRGTVDHIEEVISNKTAA